MILDYLQPPYQQNGMELKSPYMAALTDARAATGRNVLTGAIEDPNKLGSWAGALTYLVLIDHIGTHFSILGSSSTDRRDYTRALNDLTILSYGDRMCIYALRCAFAHNYSLINIGVSKNVSDKALLHHQFEVNRGEILIEYPATPWDGIRTPANYGLVTKVSLKKIGDLVESMHSRLLTMAFANPTQVVKSPDAELIFITYAVAAPSLDASMASGSTVNR